MFNRFANLETLEKHLDELLSAHYEYVWACRHSSEREENKRRDEYMHLREQFIKDIFVIE